MNASAQREQTTGQTFQFTALVYCRGIEAKASVFRGVGKDSIGYSITIRVDAEWILTCFIKGQVDRSTDIGNKGMYAFCFTGRRMPDRTICAIDHIGIFVRPVRKIRLKIESFDHTNILYSFIMIGIVTHAVVDQQSIQFDITDLNEWKRCASLT